MGCGSDGGVAAGEGVGLEEKKEFFEEKREEGGGFED